MSCQEPIKTIQGAYAWSYRDTMEEMLLRVRARVCKVCGIRPSQYDEAHYDLAEEWFRYHDYLEYTARVFMLSATYHRWWNQQLALLESQFLERYSYKEIPASVMRDKLFEAIITMNIHPSSDIRRVMHNEGALILKSNPHLSNIKMYRYGTPA